MLITSIIIYSIIQSLKALPAATRYYSFDEYAWDTFNDPITGIDETTNFKYYEFDGVD